MRNLWLFISKYSAFLLFSIFFILSLLLVISNNSFQKASAINTSNKFIGEGYARLAEVQTYLHLAQINDSLASENARLQNMLKSSYHNDSIISKAVTDTLNKVHYTYIVAKVVDNSIRQRTNFITINRGRKHGIEKGMGVMGANGVVGIVRDVSDNFSTVTSLLNTDIKISAAIRESKAFGSLVWGENIDDSKLMILQDIPNHIVVKRGEHIVTSGYSTLFPPGLDIGHIVGKRSRSGDNFPDIIVKLHTDFATLQYVYVIKNSFAAERAALDALKKPNE